MSYIFTSESVSAGHPDKVADQISDTILDAALEKGDETTRVAVETLVTTNFVVLAGEVKNFNLSEGEVELLVRDKIREIGYEQAGFDWKTVEIINRIHSQSGDIALGTDDFGAGDQGIMFGYATNETPSLMPAPIHYSHEILKALSVEQKSNPKLLGPDAKCQVSFEYEDEKPVRATTVLVSSQHGEGLGHLANELVADTIRTVMGNLIDDETKIIVNPTGNFVIGGPDGDAGLTGRKIIVDTYGGRAPHGGGAFSGKDATKVDRSAAYMARWLAKKAVASGLTSECLVQLSYAIGVKEPVSVFVEAPTNKDKIYDLIAQEDLTPYGIIKKFDLFNFKGYSKNCIFGHFGDKDVPWEKV